MKLCFRLEMVMTLREDILEPERQWRGDEAICKAIPPAAAAQNRLIRFEKALEYSDLSIMVTQRSSSKSNEAR